jgi:drug/metabolite transporter (DMT)-like permease
MVWLAFAILTALFESLKDEYLVTWASMAFAVMFLLPVIWWTGIPPLGDRFWFALLIGGTLNVISFTLYVKAIKISELSLTVPMVTLTPLFLLVTSPLIVQESASFTDVIGILLIVIGSYVLNLKERSKGYFAPLKAIFREKGSRLMFTVAFIWSITSNFDKVGVVNSSPMFWTISLFGFIALGITPLVLLKSRKSVTYILPNLKGLITIGLFNALAVSFQMVAVTYTLVAQVIAVKRTSALMSVLFGHFLFQEKGLKERLAGAAIMVSGVILIATL